VPELTPPDGPRELPPTGEYTTGSLGRYKILGELGRGGCGIVYRALDPSIGRMVAIKTILAKTDSSPGKESRERFRREARAAGNLSHPNIVTVHDFSDSGDPMFIAMEFIEGRTLAEAMSRGPLALDFILGVLRSAADALDYAHLHHIVHRDIKPANFLINESGRLKITDFGIAKMLDGDEGLTSTGMVVGTAQYMSPEQISEMHVTGRSDQFSLAVIAYEMLAGVKPFPGTSWATVIHAIIMAEPAPITKYRNTLGDGVDTVLRKALSKDPTARYTTCTEFCDALQRELSGAVVERTLVFATPPDAHAPVAPAESEKTRVAGGVPPGIKSGGPSTTREIQPGLAKSPPAANKPWTPVLIGAVGAVVISAGAWIGLRSVNPRLATQTTAESPVLRLPPSEPVSPPETEAKPVVPAPETKPTVKPKEQVKVQAKVEPRRPDKAPVVAASQAPPPSAPVTNPTNPAPPKVETAPVVPVQAIPTPTPTPVAPPPAPVPTKAQDDQAKRADEQAKRLAEEQTRRAAEDQAKRLSEEQAKNARTAEFAAISGALRDYQAAYNRKDLAALQAIWPAIPKPVLDGIRGSFRDASVVSMDLRAVGDPKVSGNTATVICDRNLRQVILNRALQASGRVRIVLNRTGSGWVIQSVDSVNQ
jgi:serine/threonine protein kinase